MYSNRGLPMANAFWAIGDQGQAQARHLHGKLRLYTGIRWYFVRNERYRSAWSVGTNNKERLQDDPRGTSLGRPERIRAKPITTSPIQFVASAVKQ